MSEQKQPAFSDVISFDIFDDLDLENNEISVANLTQEEQEELF